ncbi:MAG TPA: hypothetical protein VGJ91_07875 [Polyangiaceae bacterium]|jgi:hypothetical protein
MRMLALAALAGLLAACASATPTPYQPAVSSRYGFQEQQIENNRVRITFNGNSLTNRETVETYLLYRAAELTLQHGADYFVLTNRDTDAHTRIQSDDPFYDSFAPRYPFAYRYYSRRHGWGYWNDPFWRSPTSFREITRYEAVAEVAYFSGRKPANDANAFDAREVQQNLQGHVVRPAAPGG